MCPVTPVAEFQQEPGQPQQVRALFEEHERQTLQVLPAERFPLYQEGRRKVHTDGHITVSHSYYSAPAEFTNREVWVQWDGRLVRIFDHRHQQIAVHATVPPGKFSTHPEHVPDRKISGAERGTRWYLDKAHRIGPNCGRWGEAVIEKRGLHGIRVLQGFVGLGSKHGWKEMEHAAGLAIKHGTFRIRVIRRILKNSNLEAEPLEFIEQHPLIRDPSEYGAMIHEAFEATELR